MVKSKIKKLIFRYMDTPLFLESLHAGKREGKLKINYF
ncbi:hypothetical protein ELI_0524 [Eubacterium callanderi]|uniref:Uncharacterized protein n=1 Tax=Eubacterium callanderi TaxID=53442 RepID=E3GIQ5_9FIRM|nr:hypothetical protein ELI_0524 [Eubacterium callanderi]